MKTASETKSISVKVDIAKKVRTMRGGIGASWHSLSRDIPMENEKYEYPVRMNAQPRGSGFGGNPPVENKSAWKQLCGHAAWLGLNFIRVELSQNMYEPERNKFDWKNEEMQALYLILDWCQKNNADVFLQQMWTHVHWNAFPGVHPLLSAPRDLDDYAVGIAALLKHLLKTKKYTCIKYFCITNEPPGGTWGYWWGYGAGSGSVTPAWKKVRKTLDANGIKLPLSGPDWTSLPPFDKKKIDFDRYIGAYDIHSYDGIDKKGEKILRDWARWAAIHKKPFFLTEFGNMNLGWGGSNPAPKSFAASLSNASDLLSGIKAGVDGFNRWSFVNRGDLDGQWQLVNTWDIEKKTYTQDVTPERTAYYGFAMLTRFVGKYSTVLGIKITGNGDDFKTAALESKNGNITVVLLNLRNTEIELDFGLKGIDEKKIFSFYQVTESAVCSPEFELNPLMRISGLNRNRQIVLPPQSISVLSTYHLTQKDPGVIE
jgi:Cellulase (glycosyl hydrolase family 5)